MKAPQFASFYPSISDMNSEQRKFFDSWRRAWSSGRALDIQGQFSYVFCYAYSLLGEPSLSNAEELCRLRDSYAHERTIRDLTGEWASDCYVLFGDYPRALEVFPVPKPSGRSLYATEKLLSLKAATGTRLSGRDVLSLFGPQVTAFGKKNLDAVSEYIEAVVRYKERSDDEGLLVRWCRDSEETDYQLFNASVYRSLRPSPAKIPHYRFSQCHTVIDFCAKLTRDAENTIREEAGLPAVGEGWIGETVLLYELRSALPDLTIIHHYSPSWLGRQHLDIYVEELEVAVEYQGLQHDRPVAYFGGDKAFEATKRRDARKRRLCRSNGVRLLYVRPGYELDAVVNEIVDRG